MDCKNFQQQLPELVLNAGELTKASREHMAECPRCEEDYRSMMTSISMMDAWQVQEPSPFFNQRLEVLMREEMAAPRLGFFARLGDYILLNTGRQFRPAVAGALLAVIMVGGGGYVGFQNSMHREGSARVSATVNDLQILDKNAQALQEMDQLLQDDDSSEDSGVHLPS